MRRLSISSIRDYMRGDEEELQISPHRDATVENAVFKFADDIVSEQSKHSLSISDNELSEEDTVSSSTGVIPAVQFYRMNEHHITDSTEHPFIRVWMHFSCCKLAYTYQPCFGDEIQIAQGYLDLYRCTVKSRSLEKPFKLDTTTIGPFCFQLRQSDSTTATFACSSSAARDDIINTLRSASNDPRYFASSDFLEPLRLVVSVTGINTEEARKEDSFITAKMPALLGAFKKKSSRRNALGQHTFKVRWFKLENGCLSYYTEPTMTANNLGASWRLFGANVHIAVDSPLRLNFEFADERSLQVEADSADVAMEWLCQCEQTTILLRSQVGQSIEGSAGIATKRRRKCLCCEDAVIDAEHTQGTLLHTPKDPPTIHFLKTLVTNHFLLKFLKNLDAVINQLQYVAYLPGDVIVYQGQPADHFFMLDSGSVEIIKDHLSIGTLGPGSVFGELALFTNAVRQATIKAMSRCVLWTLRRSSFCILMLDQEAQEKKEKMEFLHTVSYWDQLSVGLLERLCEVMEMVQFMPNQKIFNQGDVSDRLYMISSGTVRLTQHSSFLSAGSELGRLGPSKVFGEFSIDIHEEDDTRKHTVTAISAVACWSIDLVSFRSVLGSIGQAREESIGIRILQGVTLLKSLSEKQLLQVSRNLSSERFDKDEVIITQGQDGDKFYMIASGSVSVQVNHIQVAQLEKNASFGELALLRNEKRNATITSLEHTHCLVLQRAAFIELLGAPLDAVIAEQQSRAAAAAAAACSAAGETDSDSLSILSSVRSLSRKLSARFFTSPPHPASPSFSPSLSPSGESIRVTPGATSPTAASRSRTRSKYAHPEFSLDSLQRLKVLGQGTFGIVYLARNVNDSKDYAVKVMSKSALVGRGQKLAVLRERELMSLADHPFIAACYATCQDDFNVYIVQQAVLCGDLWTYLHGLKSVIPRTKLGGFAVGTSAFYSGCALCALEHLHDRDITYRDIRPENLCVDLGGFLKLVDFGCAKKLNKGESTSTLCGTPEYLAPELILSKGHNRGVDFWGLGVFIFELLTASTPFEHDNIAKIYQNIVECERGLDAVFSTKFDYVARDIVLRLLAFKCISRLGMSRKGIEDIWRHSFFNHMSKRGLELKSVVAPFIPGDGDDGAGSGDALLELHRLVVHSENFEDGGWGEEDEISTSAPFSHPEIRRTDADTLHVPHAPVLHSPTHSCPALMSCSVEGEGLEREGVVEAGDARKIHSEPEDGRRRRPFVTSGGLLSPRFRNVGYFDGF